MLSILSLLVMLITILFIILFYIVLIFDLLKFVFICLLVTLQGHLDLLCVISTTLA